MAVLPICIIGEPVLHEPTAQVTEPVAELAQLISDMFDTMDAAQGVGLSANQVGVGKRFFVYDCPDIDDAGVRIRRRGVVINPILEHGPVPETMPDPDRDIEGCLSVPGEQFPTGRADWAKVTGVDEHGDAVELEGHGFFARMLQHEVGHLDGHLYVEQLIGRNARAAKRAIRDEGWGKPGLSWVPSLDENRKYGYED